ncbi:hypothetical protein [Pantoea sp. BAV 3049]|uniref:hypothetical protein n=1 Tax=Pantoea sp. BAV 3049 TaxID=2654188 RepID=UPI00131D2DA3|nr:hypothetical protein [Pantoea sp. BAV 3049]
MTTSADIINTLAGKTKTLGYDAVIAYDRDKINHLLEQQYVSKRADGAEMPVFNWTNSDGTVRFSDLTLSAPRISFENATITDSRVSVTMEFVRGSIAKLNTDNQVTRYTRVRPGGGVYLKLDVDLKKGSGTVDTEGHVILDLSAGSVNTTNVDDDPAAEIIPYFEQWLKNNPVTYSVGQLSMDVLDTVLTPTDFIIRTQPAGNTNKGAGYGAVLLFVLTKAHPSENATSLPDETFPWLIPDDHSSAILVNNLLVMNQFVKKSMDSVLDTGEWTLTREGSSSDTAWELVASDNATLRLGFVNAENRDSSGGLWNRTWSGDFVRESGHAYDELDKDFIYELAGAKIKTEGGFVLTPDSDRTFINHFGLKYSVHDGSFTDSYGYSDRDVTFSPTGQGNYTMVVNTVDESIQLTGGSNNIHVSSNFWDKFGDIIKYYDGATLADLLHEKLDSMVSAAVSALLSSVSFEPISVFAVDHLLFPEQNINQLKDASMPGDMIVFGDIAPSLTSLSVTPLTSTVSVGQSVQFTASDDVTWSVSPADSGTISADGLYQAPAALESALINVKITATGTDGATESAYVAVVPSSVMISPAFIAVKEVAGSPSTWQFTADLTDGTDLSGWSVEAAESGGLTGVIDENGQYTTPSDAWPKGYSWVNVKATASDGQAATARVLLVSHATHAEFPVTPPLLTEMTLGSVQKFSATGDGEIDPDTWSLYPEAGSGSLGDTEISGTDDEPVYTVSYTSPETVSGDELVIVTTMSDGMPLRAGYAIVDVGYNQE